MILLSFSVHRHFKTHAPKCFLSSFLSPLNSFSTPYRYTMLRRGSGGRYLKRTSSSGDSEADLLRTPSTPPGLVRVSSPATVFEEALLAVPSLFQVILLKTIFVYLDSGQNWKNRRRVCRDGTVTSTDYRRTDRSSEPSPTCPCAVRVGQTPLFR